MDDVSLSALRGAMDLASTRHQELSRQIADGSFAQRVGELRAVAQMTQNAVNYQSLAQLAAARLHLLQSIAHDGRR